MKVRATFKANTETAEVMQPGMRTFDDPTDFSKAATVRLAAPRDTGWDVARMKDASVFVMYVTTVDVDTGRLRGRPRTPPIGPLSTQR